jgi:hypothetical protein
MQTHHDPQSPMASRALNAMVLIKQLPALGKPLHALGNALDAKLKRESTP